MQSKPPQGRITRANFERELYLVVEHFQQGRIKLSKDTTFNSLRAVRLVPNLRIDLNTVGGSVRSMALAITSFAEDEEQNLTESPTS